LRIPIQLLRIYQCSYEHYVQKRGRELLEGIWSEAQLHQHKDTPRSGPNCDQLGKGIIWRKTSQSFIGTEMTTLEELSLIRGKDEETNGDETQHDPELTLDCGNGHHLIKRTAVDTQAMGFLDSTLIPNEHRLTSSTVCSMKDAYLREVPDSTAVETFATAIDEIIVGRKTSPRVRSKIRTERSVLCEKCGASFTSVGNLNRHRRVSHQGVRVFCEFKACKQVRILSPTYDIFNITELHAALTCCIRVQSLTIWLA